MQEHSLLKRRQSIFTRIGLDILFVSASFYWACAIASRDFSPFEGAEFGLVLATVTGVSIGAMLGLRQYRASTRYLGMNDAGVLLSVCVASAITFWVAESFVPFVKFSDSLLAPLLYFVFVTGSLTSIRLASRWMDQYFLRKKLANQYQQPRRLLIVGAGDEAALAIRELSRMPIVRQIPVGLVDDDPSKFGLRIHGISVIGTTNDVERLVNKLSIDDVLVTMSSMSSDRLREFVGTCNRIGVRARTIPAVHDLLNGAAVLQQARDIDVTDLLRRDRIKASADAGAGYLRGFTVLITGGGGSIGSELARQVARLGPSELILVGKGENSIFEIEQQLIQEGCVPPTAIIADVRDTASMSAIFRRYRPNVVFHAAAHKHVPLMEANPQEAIFNNVLGTAGLVEVAVANGTEKFILVSTDKAVNPKNVMGATKRLAEIVVQAQAQNSDTDFAIVRFGNVLGSRGSLVPAIRAQIRQGGPVRVTHPDMTRFFMTIPEAVQLIVQAGEYGKRGEVFILDMGEPVKVLDLVKDIIRLHGLEPDESMPILITGPRPGEKLHEELTFDREQLRPTDHPKIGVADCNALYDADTTRAVLDRLRLLCLRGEIERAVDFLMVVAQGRLSPAQDLATFNDDLSMGAVHGSAETTVRK